jgi:hypothetical protein
MRDNQEPNNPCKKIFIEMVNIKNSLLVLQDIKQTSTPNYENLLARYDDLKAEYLSKSCEVIYPNIPD